MNTVKVIFLEGKNSSTTQTSLWQYDYGQILLIDGLTLPSIFQIHFCNCGDNETITVIGEDNQVNIPDQFFLNGENIIGYIYLHTGENDGETEYKITIPIKQRQKPSDISPTPEEESLINQLVVLLENSTDSLDKATTSLNEATSQLKEAINKFDNLLVIY